MNRNRGSTGNRRTRFDRRGGYTAGAAWLALDPDNEALIFRKFDRLAVLNLLYLQSEILELEEQIDQLHNETLESYDMDLKDAAKTWETLVSQYRQDPARDDAKRRMDLILALREKIKEYHEALLLQTEVAKLNPPVNRVLKAVKHFFEFPHPLLGGKAKTFLEDEQDLVALKHPEGSDYISNLLRRHWAKEKEPASLSSTTQPSGKETYYARFNERSVQIVINTITIIIAAIFLIGSVATFSFLENKTAQLVALTGFTVAFSICIGLITNARRVEIFAATAAYAAVLVVFMGTDGASNSLG